MPSNAGRFTLGIALSAAVLAMSGATLAQAPAGMSLPAIAPSPPVQEDAFVRRLCAPMMSSLSMSRDMAERRRGMDEKFFGPQLEKANALYPYTSNKSTLAACQ